MAELERILKLFDFSTIDDVTEDSLKKAFKHSILKAHPDKGGSSELFDDILHSYVYLSEVLQRMNGGRMTLHNIISPDELKGQRSDEIIARVFDEFDRENFNEEFEKKNTTPQHGYIDWLKASNEDTNVIEGKYGSATQKPPTISEKDFNTVFEMEAKKGKPEPTAIILHPEAMAYAAGNTCSGALINEQNGGSYTADMFHNPEYTDIYEAYSQQNTVCDKVRAFDPNSINGGNIDEIIAERNKEITPLTSDELNIIKEFEKKRIENDIRNKLNGGDSSGKFVIDI